MSIVDGKIYHRSQARTNGYRSCLDCSRYRTGDTACMYCKRGYQDNFKAKENQ